MSATLARMGIGFADPTHDAQQTFRTLLDAMSRPGQVLALPESTAQGLAPAQADLAPPVGAGMAAALLTLLDAESPVLLAGALDDDAVRAWIRFHTSARAATAADAPAMAAAAARDVTPAVWQRLALGTDESPQDGATLIVEVDGLCGSADAGASGAVALELRGPGIESTQALAVRGLCADFWRWRLGLASALPRGVDLVLVHGTAIAAIPRSSRVALRSTEA